MHTRPTFRQIEYAVLKCRLRDGVWCRGGRRGRRGAGDLEHAESSRRRPLVIHDDAEPLVDRGVPSLGLRPAEHTLVSNNGSATALKHYFF